ncbi:MAG: AEC family transporter [Rhodospirillaceae bacterium]
MGAEIFSIIAPVLFGVGVGYTWSKMGRSFDAEFATAIVYNIATPLLIFSTLTSMKIDVPMFSELAGVMTVAALGFILVGYVILKVWGLDRRTYWPSISIPNSGNMGLPLAFIAFGQEGLGIGVIVYTVISMNQFTFSVIVSSGHFSFRELMKIPLIYAVIAALLVMGFGLEVPAWIASTSSIYGQLVIPLMLIALGVSLASLKISSFPRSLAIAVFRILIGFTIALGVTEVFGLNGVAQGVIILQSAMPAAVFNYMLALRYNNSPPEIAGVVITSTVFSFLTLPLLLWFVL